MSDAQVRYHITRAIRKYQFLRLAEITMVAIAAGLTAFTFVQFSAAGFELSLFVSVVIAAAWIIFRSTQLKIFRVDEDQMIRFVNRTYPELQESGDLLLKDDTELSTLQRLQKRKSVVHFEEVYSRLKFPHQIKAALGVITISVAMFVAGTFLFSKKDSPQKSSEVRQEVQAPIASVIPGIDSSFLRITPPGYTRRKSTSQRSYSLSLVQGSKVDWLITFSAPIERAALIFYGKDTVALHKIDGRHFSADRLIQSTGFYQVAWYPSTGTARFSDYFQIDVTRDQPPVIKIENLDQFVELSMTDNLRVDLKAKISDDYGLRDSYIIATVSKGSGESVKFREEKLRFSIPSRIEGTSTDASMKIDLIKLGLDPGDELYFYVEALDNKTPSGNKTRTETYFIALQDTTEMTTSVDPGLGVDLMPEYFRSQRQIIIDTEKLLKQKAKLAKDVFKSTSNELGYDEKVLRLRYGEFLGEEFETNIGPVAGAETGEDDKTVDVAKQYGHQHDTEKEHDSAEPSGHAHSNERASDKSDPSKDYMHAHDSEEEATFFNRSIRAKLKAAVTIMWDAELHLRLYEPEKSLPFQYKALKLLKEISQDSRIYVHRTGFDPPPLKEEKRLSGELSEVKSSTDSNVASSESYIQIRLALKELEGLDESGNGVLSQHTRSLLLKAGNELSGIALLKPGRYLKSLSLIKSLADDEVPPQQRASALREVKSAFYSVIPQHALSGQSKVQAGKSLNDRFLKKLEQLQTNP